MQFYKYIFVIILLLSKASYANSFSEYLNNVYKTNPEILSARTQLDQVKEQLNQSYSGFKPNLNLEAGVRSGETRNSFNNDSFTTKFGTLSLTQNLYNGGKNKAKVSYSKNLVEAQEQTLKRIEQDIMRDFVKAYMDVLTNQSLYKLAKKNKTILQRQLKATNHRFKQERVTITDVKQSELRLAEAEANVIRLEADLSLSKAVINRIYGSNIIAIKSTIGLPVIPSSLDETLDKAKNNSPEILVAQNQLLAAEYNIDTAFADLLPLIQFKASYSFEEDPATPIFDRNEQSQAGVFLTLPLYNSGINRSRIREAKYKRSQFENDLNAITRRLEQDVISSWKIYKSSEAEIKARSRQVEFAKIAKEGVYAEAGIGNRTIIEKLNAEQELLNAKTQLEIAKRNKIISAYNLSALLGNINVN